MSEKGLLCLVLFGILIFVFLLGFSLRDQTQEILNPTPALVIEGVAETDTACDNESEYSLFPAMLLVAVLIGATAGLSHSALFKKG